MQKHFSLYKRNGIYYVQYRQADGAYGRARSTRTRDYTEAETRAYGWLFGAAPEGEDVRTVNLAAPLIRHIKGDEGRTRRAIAELQKYGVIAGVIYPASEADITVTDYLTQFWDYEQSDYLRERRRAGHATNEAHVRTQLSAVKRYWIPVLGDKKLGELTRDDLDALANRIEGQVFSGGRKNGVMIAGTTALRYAFRKGLIPADITAGVVRFAVKNKQRDILETAEAEAIFKIEWRDKAARLANMLAMITGLRAGEVMALRKDDIRPSSLLIRQAYSVIDKFKTPKNGEARVVQVPFPDVIAALIRRADSNPHGDGLVFYSTRPGKPIEHRQLLAGLRAALETCGIETKATFHSWRHYYTTKLRGTLPDSELQTQTGHKTAAMLDLYGGHQLAEKTARIAQATRAAFNIREFKREGA